MFSKERGRFGACGPAQVQELHHVEAPLAAFHLSHEPLAPTEAVGDLLCR